MSIAERRSHKGISARLRTSPENKAHISVTRVLVLYDARRAIRGLLHSKCEKVMQTQRPGTSGEEESHAKKLAAPRRQAILSLRDGDCWCPRSRLCDSRHLEPCHANSELALTCSALAEWNA